MKLYAKAFYRELLHQQKEWMAERGGDLAGYIAYYCERHNQSQRRAKSLYNADCCELSRIEGRLED